MYKKYFKEEARIKKLKGASIENEITYEYTSKDAVIVFSDERPNGSNSINIQTFDVENKGRGTGTNVFESFLDYIEMNFPVDSIILHPETSRNRTFYKRFGFKDFDSGLMILKLS